MLGLHVESPPNPHGCYMPLLMIVRFGMSLHTCVDFLSVNNEGE